MSDSPNPRLFRLLWGLVGVLLVVVVVLGGIAGWRQVQRSLFSDDIFPAPEADGSIGFGLREGLVRAEVFVPDRPHNLDEVPTLDLRKDFKRKRRFELSTNSYGLRSPDPPAGSSTTPDIVVPAPGFRVVCLGASITFGWGVSYEESYPAKLGEALGVDVVNAGAPAADHFLLSDWAAEHLAGLDPDLVLFNVRPAYLDRAGSAEVLAQAVEKVRAAAGGARVAVVMPPLSTFDLQTQDIVRE
ncbi:MAG: GDSL-type esterase/lipase family protein, partial [Myxococcota bacterium]|nr:GDSL-type esterase/lipase family protein [Myxococcota bacterium]